MTDTITIKSCGGDESECLMARGHHEPKRFMKAARAWYGEPLKGFDPPQQMWWRAVPDRTGEYRSMYHEAQPHSRGAFPVTVTTRF